MNDKNKKGITLDISDDGEVSVKIPIEEESKENGYRCLICDQICKHCQHIPDSEDWLPAVVTCTASSNPQRVFDLQRCPEGIWYRGKPLPPPQDPKLIKGIEDEDLE